ncbi:sensor histidine kinase [Nonomuraea turkmeniaca]|uniref:sensor histidine kinase n=1 Tax=Nonomuraea turkmeniaca TaxID=103838 RepID=UPI001476D304|nr:histidine kinase [Nonomuraea turkmeniaca]
MPVTEIRPPLFSRVPRWAWVLLDGLWAVVVAFLYLQLASYHDAGWAGAVSALATTLPLAVRRIWPRTAFCVVIAGEMGMLAMVPGGGDVLAVPMAAYAVARFAGRTWAVGALLTALAVAATVLFRWPMSKESIQSSLWVVGVLVAFWAAGAMMRERSLYVERLAAHAEERARAEATEERLRIARELHDVVGHSLSTIAVQAGVAEHVGKPEVMRRALRSIGETSRSALHETRRLLGILREDGEASRAPAPTLSDLPELVERTRTAGVDAYLSVTGDVPRELELTVYRIVQEALTNVIKHAGADHARATVVREEEGIRVEVVDDGRGGEAGAAAAGHGLAGLRERVRVFGGAFEAGPRPLHGFRVYAFLPVQGAPEDPPRRPVQEPLRPPPTDERPHSGQEHPRRPPGEPSGSRPQETSGRLPQDPVRGPSQDSSRRPADRLGDSRITRLPTSAEGP